LKAGERKAVIAAKTEDANEHENVISYWQLYTAVVLRKYIYMNNSSVLDEAVVSYTRDVIDLRCRLQNLLYWLIDAWERSAVIAAKVVEGAKKEGGCRVMIHLYESESVIGACW
jgi:hypothetical protein